MNVIGLSVNTCICGNNGIIVTLYLTTTGDTSDNMVEYIVR
jgi:hypothetical protein